MPIKAHRRLASGIPAPLLPVHEVAPELKDEGIITYQVPSRVASWSYLEAPAELRVLFPGNGVSSWVVHVPEPELLAVEPFLMRWQPVYPVTSVKLADQSVVYCGAPEDALRLVAQRGLQIAATASSETDGDVRVRLEWPSRYETSEPSRQTGDGHTLEWTPSEVSFTTNELLSKDAKVTLYVAWPIRLDGNVEVRLRVHGRLARAEAAMAAVQLEEIGFTAVG